MNISFKVRTRFAVEVAIVFAVLTGLAVWISWDSPERRRQRLLEAVSLAESGKEADAQKAFSTAQSLADKGERSAKILMAILLTRHGSPLPHDEKRGKDLYVQAREEGSLLACRIFPEAPRPASSELMVWKKQALCGDVAAQSLAGFVLSPSDPILAASYYEAAAANGDAGGYIALGRLYLSGRIGQRDIEKARPLLRKAFELGASGAGRLLYDIDVRREFSATGKLKESGPYDFSACQQDAEFGDAECQFKIGLHYWEGDLVPKDIVLAYKWLNLSAARSWDFGGEIGEKLNQVSQLMAREARDSLQREMTSAQVTEAQRMSREWKPKEVRKIEKLPFFESLLELRDEIEGRLPAIPKAATASLASKLKSEDLDSIADQVFAETAPPASKPESRSIESVADKVFGAESAPPASKPEPRQSGITSRNQSLPLTGATSQPGAQSAISAAANPQSASAPLTQGGTTKKAVASESRRDLVSESLCGKLTKDRTAFALQSGPIKGCVTRAQGGYSSITVDNTGNISGVLVKLYPAGSRDAASLRVFTVAGKSEWTETNVQPGEYELRYEDLDSRDHLKTESFRLRQENSEGGVQYSKLRVTLYKVAGGNMKTSPISESEFND